MDMPLTSPARPPRSARRVEGRRHRLSLREQHRPTVERLAGVALFAHCTPRQLATIDALGTHISIEPGCVLVREGTRAKEFFVIIDGHATVSIGGRTLQTLPPGQCFGDVGLLEQHRRLATVTAATPMALVVFAPNEFSYLLDAAPPVALTMLRTHLARLRAAQAFAVGLETTSAGGNHPANRRTDRVFSAPTEEPSTHPELLMCV
jgi:CRP-like cAMP-binding protein